MKSHERTKLKEKALKLYLEGMAKDSIAPKLHISKKALYKWENQDNWKEKLQELTRKVTEKVTDTVALEKERSLKLISATEGLYAEKLKQMKETGIIDINVPGFAQLQRIKWEILQPRQITNQLNLQQNISFDLKQDIEHHKEIVSKLLAIKKRLKQEDEPANTQ